MGTGVNAVRGHHGRSHKAVPQPGPQRRPLQAGIAAPHFADMETEAQGGDVTSEAGSLGAGPLRSQLSPSSPWLPAPP